MKEKITLTLDEDVLAYYRNKEVNISHYVNGILKLKIRKYGGSGTGTYSLEKPYEQSGMSEAQKDEVHHQSSIIAQQADKDEEEIDAIMGVKEEV